MSLNHTLLEGIILSAVKKQTEGTYGYEVCRTIRHGKDVPESSIYQALHKLCKEKYISSYSMVVKGRNRKIYKITEEGLERLHRIKKEWDLFSQWVTCIL